MTKRIGKDEKWCFETNDGKVYLQEPDGKITQIGWGDWRVVTPPNGNKLLPDDDSADSKYITKKKRK